MKLKHFGILCAVALVAISSNRNCRADVIWNLTTLDASGNVASTFNVGQTGFIDVSVTLTGAELAANASLYQAVISQSNSAGITVGAPVDSNTTPNPGDDIHSTPPSTVSSSPTQYVVGELSFAPAPPPASTSLFRLPFTVDAPGPSAYTFSAIANAVGTPSQSSWNGQTANLVFGASSSTTFNVTAVPEPTAFGLFALLGSVGILRRRRQ